VGEKKEQTEEKEIKKQITVHQGKSCRREIEEGGGRRL